MKKKIVKSNFARRKMSLNNFAAPAKWININSAAWYDGWLYRVVEAQSLMIELGPSSAL